MRPPAVRRLARPIGRGAALLAALLAASLPAQRAAAQLTELAPPRDTAGMVRRVDGRVVRPHAGDVAPVPGIWVVLHRVGSDAQGPLDSMRTTASGAFRFRYTATGVGDAIYFLSASYGGLAYFSAPLRDAAVSGDDADILVYDTTSRAVPIAVRGHHIVVAAPTDGAREIIEVYELSNDSSVTRVAPSSGEPVWSALLPSGARAAVLREGDLGADAVVFEEGRVNVFAPIAPGLRQLAYSYEVPADALPLSIPVEHHAETLEVLVESPSADVSGARLARTDPVSVEGRNFSRFLADEAPPNAVVRVAVGEAAAARRGLQLRVVAIAVGAAMLLALARIAARSRRRGGLVVRAGDDDPERLAGEIAALDAAHERRRAPSDAATREYRARREALKARLTDALDRQHQER
ncbi:MAG TPA: hypothetical protein VFZ11_04275 [Gemmatimonadaceae bacterium]